MNDSIVFRVNYFVYKLLRFLSRLFASRNGVVSPARFQLKAIFGKCHDPSVHEGFDAQAIQAIRRGHPTMCLLNDPAKKIDK